jgi:hypothetical protein
VALLFVDSFDHYTTASTLNSLISKWGQYGFHHFFDEQTQTVV